MKPHRTSPEEIHNLLAVAERDLQDARAPGLSPDCQLNIAYNAALQLAAVSLAASGYRAAREGHHYRLIQSLRLTLGVEEELVLRLDLFRRKRNILEYERVGVASNQEVQEMLQLAQQLREEVGHWLKVNHSALLEPPDS